MDFFEHQDDARRKTTRLVLLFAVAVVAIIAGVYAALTAILLVAAPETGFAFWSPDRALGITAGTGFVIGGGSAYKTWALSAGSSTLAVALGGHALDPSSDDPADRRLRNVVEEMAIASGTPVPPVFVLENEHSINAFASGKSPQDAVIAVTRGALERLSRDELQGVIAHEFSHILNGDVGLNLRLIGVLHGILLIATIGSIALRSSARSGRGRSNQALLVGLALLVVGYVGLVFGRLIKSAVSRQREYLADASAVQFTRNPDGIAGALKKIGGIVSGSSLRAARAEEASHMFFADGIGFSSLFATHPPLPDRIRRIDPRFDGRFPTIEIEEPPAAAKAAEAPTARPAPIAPAGVLLGAALGGAGAGVEGETFGIDARAVAASVGAPTQDHLRHASELLSALPAALRDATHEPLGAVALVYGVLLDADPGVRDRQRTIVAEQGGRAVDEELRRLLRVFEGCPAEVRLPIVDLALPTLTRLSPEQYRTFRETVHALVRADDETDAFEFALGRLLLRRLAPAFEGRRPGPTSYYALQRLGEECSVLLSTLVHAGRPDEEAAARAFDRAAGALGRVDGMRLLPADACAFDRLDEALATLETVAPKLKRDLVTACAIAVEHDGEVTVEEAELLRAVTDGLGCPLPPFLEVRRAAPQREA